MDHPQQQRVTTSLGPIDVRIWDGPGPTVVPSHPVLTDGRYWEPLVEALDGRLRVVVPDLPMGAHRLPVPDRERLSLRGVADALGEVASAVADDPVILVGNDTGGAVAQIATARHPGTVRGLVLAPCEVFERCPPRGFGPLIPLLRRPAGARLLVRTFGLPPLMASPGPLNILTRRGFPRPLVDSWLRASLRDREVLGDLAALLASMRPEETLSAADGLATWDGRAAVVWGRSGVLFPARDGRRMATHLSADPVVWLDGVGALAAWDRPDAVAEALLKIAVG